MAKKPLVKIGYTHYLFTGDKSDLLDLFQSAELLQEVDSDYVTGKGMVYTAKEDGKLDLTFEMVDEKSIQVPEAESDYAAINEAKKRADDYQTKFFTEQREHSALKETVKNTNERLANLEELVACYQTSGAGVNKLSKEEQITPEDMKLDTDDVPV